MIDVMYKPLAIGPVLHSERRPIDAAYSLMLQI